MTVAAATTETIYVISGTNTGPFSTVFTFEQASDLVVYLDKGAGPQKLTNGSDYTLSDPTPLSSGGSVTLSASLIPGTGSWANGTTLSLTRYTGDGQPSAFGEALNFSPAAMEAAVDHISRQVQDVRSKQARAICGDYGESGFVLPSVVNRKGALCMFDATSGNIVIGPTPTALMGMLAGPDATVSNTTPQAGVSAGVDFKWEDSPYTAESFGGLWSDNTFFWRVFNKDFTAANAPAAHSDNSPAVSCIRIATNTGTPCDVVAGMDLAQAKAANAAIWGNNSIACGDNHNGQKLVGMEIDWEPETGTSPAGTGGGLFINAFSVNAGNPGIYVNGIYGGKFQDHFTSGSCAGAMFSAAGSSSAQWGLNLTNATFSQPAIFLAQQHVLEWNSAGQIRGDGGGNINVFPNGSFVVQSAGSTEGASIAAVQNSTGVQTLVVETASGTQGNGANSGLIVRANSATGRSINAGGTINASGADYAEYEIKAEGVGQIAKGDLVGFDAEGRLTLEFDAAVGFGVKSTAPNLVGGDGWHAEAGDKPQAPHLEIPHPGDEPRDVSTVRKPYQEALAEENAERRAQWRQRMDGHLAAVERHKAALEVHAGAMAEWQGRHDALRAKVDRIAYCGKVPVNVTGARPGQYVVPVRTEAGGIAAQLVDAAEISFADYRRAVGQVRRVLEDGRAEIVVKPI